jgi:DNA-binding CsgD family transcriptional regulator
MTTTPHRPATSSTGMAALEVAWTLNGLEITIASSAGPGLDLRAAEMDLSSQPPVGPAEPDRVLLPALIRVALGLLGETHRPAPPPGEPAWPDEPLTESEARVLRYLPTYMGSPEIAAELYVSANTVKTHLRHLYRKLGAHSRQEAVQRAQAIGLLAAPSSRRWKADRGTAQIISLSKELGRVR